MGGHWRKNHDTDVNHLRHYDLLDEASSHDGRDVYFTPTLLIERVSVDKVKSRQKPNGERRNFIHFKGKGKPLGLNVTNCETLESISGSSDPARWVGLKVQLYVDREARYPSGKKGPAIRIRPTRASGPVDDMPQVSEEARARLDEEQQAALREPGQEG